VLCNPRLSGPCARTIAIAAIAMLASSPRGLAGTWDNGSANSQWSTGSNWADNTEPTINDPVIFPSPIPFGLATITLISGEFASTPTATARWIVWTLLPPTQPVAAARRGCFRPLGFSRR
jgi:hypothetical protein